MSYFIESINRSFSGAGTNCAIASFPNLELHQDGGDFFDSGFEGYCEVVLFGGIGKCGRGYGYGGLGKIAAIGFLKC